LYKTCCLMSAAPQAYGTKYSNQEDLCVWLSSYTDKDDVAWLKAWKIRCFMQWSSELCFMNYPRVVCSFKLAVDCDALRYINGHMRLALVTNHTQQMEHCCPFHTTATIVSLLHSTSVVTLYLYHVPLLYIVVPSIYLEQVDILYIVLPRHLLLSPSSLCRIQQCSEPCFLSCQVDRRKACCPTRLHLSLDSLGVPGKAAWGT
jgi:hypothetical protein